MMNMVFEREYTLRASDFNKYGKIHPSAVLDLFQDAAGQHSELINVGMASMLERGYLWVLLKVKLQILEQPKSYQTVKIKTWPLKPNRLVYKREYIISDQNGRRLIVGSSEWAVIDSKNRKLLSVPDLYPFSDGFCEDTVFDGRIGKIHGFETGSEPYYVRAGFSELDGNNHVNNTRYANFIADAVNPCEEDEIESFQIEYRKEVMQGTELQITFCRNGNGITAKGCNNSFDVMFMGRIELKDQKP